MTRSRDAETACRGRCVDEAGKVSRVETTEQGPEEQLTSEGVFGEGRTPEILRLGWASMMRPNWTEQALSPGDGGGLVIKGARLQTEGSLSLAAPILCTASLNNNSICRVHSERGTKAVWASLQDSM
jgi:hypothetical protein